MVMVEVPVPPAIRPGEKVALVPTGRPLALKEISFVNPFSGSRSKATLALEPADSVGFDGVGAMEKSLTLNVTTSL